MNGWSVVDQTPTASAWSVVSGELHQNNRVESTFSFQQSYHLGTYAYLSAGMGWTDYRFSADATYLAKPYAEDIGVMFRYQDPSNYYRLALNSRYGFTRLEKRVGGQFIPLATDARGYTDGELLHIVIELQGSSIRVYINGDPLFAVSDTSLASGTVALYSQDQGKFDNVQVELPTTAPSIVIAAPLAHSVLTSGSTLTVTASAANVPTNGYVEFVLDDGTSLTDNTPPFTQTFSAVGAGIHKVDAILRNSSGVELVRDTNTDVSTQGDYMVAVGDSITNGIGDFYASDNTSLYGRIIAFEGYESVLTDILNTTEPYPTNIVFNEGIGGDETYDAAFTRIRSILDRHPRVDKVLILLGTNDASNAIPSGLGCTGAACNGTFKGNLQTLVNEIRWADYPADTVASNITPIVALVGPQFRTSSPWNATSNNLIRDYNSIISSQINGIQIGPDFFSYFMPSATQNYRSLFYDEVHPNSLGHVALAYLWHNVLDSANPLPLPFVLDGLVASTGAPVQQNLIERGDSYYLDNTFTVSGSIPAIVQNGRWIISNNADRGDASSNYLSFNVDRPVNIYVAYDGAVSASSLPTWMAGFSDTGQTLSTTDLTTPTLKLYVKGFPAGSITLGGNTQGSSGAHANYIAIVVAN
jgi:lysophospholipase L1-like esterase